MKKFLKLFVVVMLTCTTLVFTLGIFTSTLSLSAMELPAINYQAHVEDKGWLDTVHDNEIAGTVNQSKRLEALILNLKENDKSMVRYRAHIADVGWQAWVTSGAQAGTTDKAIAIQAFQAELTNEYKDMYDIYYRVHVPYRGWLGWAKNGEIAGSIGLALRTEAIQIKLVIKGSQISTEGLSSLTKPTLTYSSHVQDMGWMSYADEGKMAGTTNQKKRMEAVKIKLSDFDGNSGLTYRTHVSDVGWQNWVSSNERAGTEGQNKPIEAIEISLSRTMSDFFDIYYRMHVSNMGWLGWAKNGETAGTIGGRIQSEAIEIKLVPRNSTFDRGGVAFVDATITIRDRIVDAAHSRLGCPYVWGGNGPNTFDCSGLVKWCYAQVGISIPRTTGELKSYGTQISVSQALPGDILWKSGHVGIYIGNGQYIHAPQTGDVVKISSVSSGNFTFARRSNEL